MSLPRWEPSLDELRPDYLIKDIFNLNSFKRYVLRENGFKIFQYYVFVRNQTKYRKLSLWEGGKQQTEQRINFQIFITINTTYN